MYSVFFSRLEAGIDLAADRLKRIIKNDSKVALFPWAFSVELDSNRLMNEYFKKDGDRYLRYINALKKIGIKEENITICDCYNTSKDKLKNIIKNSDILFLPGGNPEMFFTKVVHETEILYDVKYFKGIIIGESAGAELQLKRYFITSKNNYYKYFAFYDGFGVIDDPFYIDVHSSDSKLYLEKLQKIANNKKKNVFAIYDNGCIIYNRKDKNIELFGNTKLFKPE